MQRDTIGMTCPVCRAYGDGCVCGGVEALEARVRALTEAAEGASKAKQAEADARHSGLGEPDPWNWASSEEIKTYDAKLSELEAALANLATVLTKGTR